MPKRKADVPSIKIFLSHRYKSPAVNLYFYELIAERTNVQFDVDIGTSSTNVTRLERMVRGADAFVGLYPFAHASDAQFEHTDLMEASRYLRLELDIAVRMRKPILVFFDERYAEMLCPPEAARGVAFDIQEIAGSGGSPRRSVFRKAVSSFVEWVAAAKALELARGKADSVGRIGVLLSRTQAANAYTPEDLTRVVTTMQANQIATPQVYMGAPQVDGPLHRWLSSLDWLVTDVGAALADCGIAGYVHAAGVPVLRLLKGAASSSESL